VTAVVVAGCTFAIIGVLWRLRDVVVALNRIADAMEDRK